MALSIKNPEADRLAKELAKATGQTVTEAVTQALHASLKIAKARRAAVEDVSDIQALVAELPDRDPRSPHDVIDHDDFGLPV
jgi:antitoxin VapB